MAQEKNTSYAITVFEYHSLEKEEYSLYDISLERLQETISTCLKENKNFRVAVFDE